MNREAFFTTLAVLVVLGVALLAWQFAYVLMLAFAGLLLAVLLRRGAVALARRTPLSVGLSMAAVILTVLGAAALFGFYAGPRISSELSQVAQTLPDAWDRIEDYLTGTTWGGYLMDTLPRVEDRPRVDIAGMLGATVSTAVSMAVNLVVVLTAGVFLALDPELYRRGLMHLVPKARRVRAREVLDELGRGLWYWLVGQSIDMAAVALMTGTGLWLIGVPLPIALGLIAGVTNFIPYLGPFIGGVPAVLIATSLGIDTALWTAGMIVVVQQIESSVLMPIIQREATALPPVLTILVVIGFGGIFGILGMLLATPLLLTGIILVRTLYVEDMLGDQEAEGGKP